MEQAHGLQHSDSRACAFKATHQKMCRLFFFLPDCTGMELLYCLYVRINLDMFAFQFELHAACYNEVVTLLEAL